MIGKQVIVEASSARWHAILYFVVAVALTLLAFETVATQTMTGNGIEFTVGSGYAYLVNQTDAPIHASVKSHAPFIVESVDRSIRYDVTSKLQEFDEVYTREVEIPLGAYDLRLTLGSNVTFSLNREAQASVTVVPYDQNHSLIMIVVTGISVCGALFFAFRSLRTDTQAAYQRLLWVD